MKIQRSVLMLLIAGAVLSLGACSAPPPFVYKKDEFNRDAVGFGRPVKDILKVTVCYAKRDTTPQQIFNLANAECAKFNKRAIFSQQDRITCPITTPIAARFGCAPTTGNVDGRGGVSVPGGASAYGYEFDFSPPNWFYGSGAPR